MIYILIQIILNIFVFKFSSGKFLLKYKNISYIIYPVLLVAFLIISENQFNFNLNDLLTSIKQGRSYGFALDVTVISSKYFLSLLLNMIFIQYIFNSYQRER